MCHAPEIQFGSGEAGRAVMPPLGSPAQTEFALAVSGQAIQNITAICAVPETADCLCSGMSGPRRRDECFCAKRTFHLFQQFTSLNNSPIQTSTARKPILPFGAGCCSAPLACVHPPPTATQMAQFIRKAKCFEAHQCISIVAPHCENGPISSARKRLRKHDV